MNISIRVLDHADTGKIAEVERKAWPAIHTYSISQIKTRIKINYQGFLGYFEGDILKGFIEGVRANNNLDFITWEQASDLINLDHKGNIIYLSNVAVGEQKKGIGSLLLNAYKIYAHSINVAELYLGSRIPTVNFYERNGFYRVKTIKNWWAIDEESKGKGVLMKRIITKV